MSQKFSECRNVTGGRGSPPISGRYDCMYMIIQTPNGSTLAFTTDFLCTGPSELTCPTQWDSQKSAGGRQPSDVLTVPRKRRSVPTVLPVLHLPLWTQIQSDRPAIPLPSRGTRTSTITQWSINCVTSGRQTTSDGRRHIRNPAQLRARPALRARPRQHRLRETAPSTRG